MGAFFTSCGEPWPVSPTSGEQDGPAVGTAGDGRGDWSLRPAGPRPRVGGKYLYAGDDRLLVRGVSYGHFQPGRDGREYHDLARIEDDFATMAANAVNVVRIPHTMPPVELLDAAGRHGLRVMVGLSAEQYAGYLIDRDSAPDVERIVRERV